MLVFGLDAGSSLEWRKTVIYENSENSQYSDIIYKHYINLPQRKPVGQIQRELGIRICQSVTFWY